jgi:CheY-like chemotaxis protein
MLIVEDDMDFIEELRQVFAEFPGHSELHLASSREAAFASLASDFFDLIVLDLKIPTIDGAWDSNPEHSAYPHAKSKSPVCPPQ